MWTVLENEGITDMETLGDMAKADLTGVGIRLGDASKILRAAGAAIAAGAAAEQQRVQAEAQRVAEEQRRQAERRRAEEQRRAEADRKRAEEQRRQQQQGMVCSWPTSSHMRLCGLLLCTYLAGLCSLCTAVSAKPSTPTSSPPLPTPRRARPDPRHTHPPH